MATRLERKLAWQFALAAVIVLLVRLEAYRSTTGALDAARRVEHAHEVLRGLEQILVLVCDAETGQRGYLLTGREPYLVPYERAVRSIDGQLAALRLLVRDDLVQRGDVERLNAPIHAKLAELRETIQLRKGNAPKDALTLVMTDRGKLTMDEIRREVERMRNTEDLRLGRLSTKSYRDAGIATLTETAGVIVALGLLAFIYRTIAREMSKRRRAETDLSRLAAIVASTDDAVIGQTLDGIVVSWNRGAERVYGYLADEMVGHSIHRIIPMEERDEHTKELERVARGEHVEYPEAARLRKDGSAITLWLRISPIRDASGKIVGVSKIARDISARKRAEVLLLDRTRALEAAQTRLSAVAEFAEALNQAGQPETYRAALACITRTANLPLAVVYDALEHAAPVPRCAVGIDQRPIESALFQGEGLPAETVRTGTVQVLQGPFEDDALRLRFGMGEVRLHSVIGWPLAFRGRCLGVLVTAHLTKLDDSKREFLRGAIEQLAIRMDGFQIEQQRLKLVADLQAQSRELQKSQREAERASRVKSEFLASMSHELRTPMNSIMGFTGRLLRKLGSTLPERELDALQTVDRNARHLLGLINAILDLSKIEAGRMELFPSLTNLVEIIRQAADAAAPLSDGKPIEVRLDLPDDPFWVDADPVMIQQVVTNLLSHGIKYTDRGTVTISLGEVIDTRLGPAARIAVRDTGIGIKPADLGRLFQQFTQLESGPGRHVGGTGLGLVISDRMVQMHGGRIEVESTLGQGSEFRVLLPRKCTPALPPSPAPPPGLPATSGPPRAIAQPLPEDRRGVTILCVDDDPDALKYLGLSFEDAGYGVLLASGHDEAINGAKARRPDLICLDLAMPGRDGYDLMRSLRADRTLAEVPIIVVSVTAQEARSLSAGARCYLAKPVDAHDLVEAVREVLAPGVGDALVIEDDADLVRLVSETLTDHGIAVRTPSNGREGLERLAEKAPAVILLDLMMPVMDGFAFLEQVQTDPLWSRIPVIVLTARALTSEEALALGRTCSAVLTKGRCDTERVVDAILQAVLPRRRLPGAAELEGVAP